MNKLFSGIVLLLYIASRYAAEPIFIAATAFPLVFTLVTALCLHFGANGRIIAAKNGTRRFLRCGVISGETRTLYYKRCIKGAPAALRTAYAAFLAGEISASGFSERVTASIKGRRRFFTGWYATSAASLCLLVFLVFYFTSPFSETLLRCVISAFVALNGATALRLLLAGYDRGARRAATRLGEMLDGGLLRVKRERADGSDGDRREVEGLLSLLEEVRSGDSLSR